MRPRSRQALQPTCLIARAFCCSAKLLSASHACLPVVGLPAQCLLERLVRRVMEALLSEGHAAADAEKGGGIVDVLDTAGVRIRALPVPLPGGVCDVELDVNASSR
jgi:hypothetical protein